MLVPWVLPTLPRMDINAALLKQSWQSWVSQDNRPRAGPAWLQWLWTLLFCAGLAVPFTVLGFLAFASGEGAWRNLSGWLQWYGKNLLVCISIGVVIHLLFDITRALFASPARVAAWRPWQRTAYYSGLPLLGVALGWPLGVRLAGQDVVVWISSRNGNSVVLGSVLMSLILTFLFHQYFATKTRQLEAERRASEAQLRLLQAQIEPHFLFNTLANVLSLIDHDAPKAKQMLSSFTDYLRSSLSSLRHQQATLGSEMELAQAYLELLQTRMEDRLTFCFDVPAELRAATLPALLLQPLIENAVHHGLEPKLEGGQVRVTARRDADVLVLEVADNGMGLGASPRKRGAGMALANLRERLSARYGHQASVHLQATEPGTLVTLKLPFEALGSP